MLNKFIGVGMVGNKGCELRYTPAGKPVSTFSMGIKRAFKSQDGETEWDNFNVVVWGKQAEPCANYLKPKSMVAIDGRILIRTYDDKEGVKRWITEVIAQDVRFLSSSKDAGPAEGKSDFISHEISEDPDNLPW